MNVPASPSSPHWLDGADPRCATAPVGGKARALHALAAAGFPVPAFAVVLPSAYPTPDLSLADLATHIAGPDSRALLRERRGRLRTQLRRSTR